MAALAEEGVGVDAGILQGGDVALGQVGAEDTGGGIRAQHALQGGGVGLHLTPHAGDVEVRFELAEQLGAVGVGRAVVRGLHAFHLFDSI